MNHRTTLPPAKPGTRVLAIDPGPTQSAWVVWDGEHIQAFRIEPNDDLLPRIRNWDFSVEHVAVEGIQSFGMSVGAEVFQTCYMVGRLLEAAHVEASLVYRKDVKLHLCGNCRAKDPNIRQAIVDRFGGKEKAVGRKATPGPLYGVSSHAWSALAVALTWHDSHATPAWREYYGAASDAPR